MLALGNRYTRACELVAELIQFAGVCGGEVQSLEMAVGVLLSRVGDSTAGRQGANGRAKKQAKRKKNARLARLLCLLYRAVGLSLESYMGNKDQQAGRVRDRGGRGVLCRPSWHLLAGPTMDMDLIIFSSRGISSADPSTGLFPSPNNSKFARHPSKSLKLMRKQTWLNFLRGN